MGIFESHFIFCSIAFELRRWRVELRMGSYVRPAILCHKLLIRSIWGQPLPFMDVWSLAFWCERGVFEPLARPGGSETFALAVR